MKGSVEESWNTSTRKYCFGMSGGVAAMHIDQMVMARSRATNEHFISLFGWLVADGWCWFVLREEYCWLVAGGWFVVREKYCWLVADKRSEQAVSLF
jgi:hypothetical protein